MNIHIRALLLLLLIPVSQAHACGWFRHTTSALPQVMSQSVIVQPSMWRKIAAKICSARTGCIVLGVALAAGVVYTLYQRKQAQKREHGWTLQLQGAQKSTQTIEQQKQALQEQKVQIGTTIEELQQLKGQIVDFEQKLAELVALGTSQQTSFNALIQESEKEKEDALAHIQQTSETNSALISQIQAQKDLYASLCSDYDSQKSTLDKAQQKLTEQQALCTNLQVTCSELQAQLTEFERQSQETEKIEDSQFFAQMLKTVDQNLNHLATQQTIIKDFEQQVARLTEERQKLQQRFEQQTQQLQKTADDRNAALKQSQQTASQLSTTKILLEEQQFMSQMKITQETEQKLEEHKMLLAAQKNLEENKTVLDAQRTAIEKLVRQAATLTEQLQAQQQACEQQKNALQQATTDKKTATQESQQTTSQLRATMTLLEEQQQKHNDLLQKYSQAVFQNEQKIAELSQQEKQDHVTQAKLPLQSTTLPASSSSTSVGLSQIPTPLNFLTGGSILQGPLYHTGNQTAAPTCPGSSLLPFTYAPLTERELLTIRYSSLTSSTKT